MKCQRRVSIRLSHTGWRAEAFDENGNPLDLALTHGHDYHNMDSMKVTVCQMRDKRSEFQEDWNRLVEHSRLESPDIILLPEMAFAPWFAVNSRFVPEAWDEAVRSHDQARSQLEDLSPSCILGSRPVNSGQKRLNQAFIWEQESGLTLAHTKYHLPNEEGYWEASWYHRGDGAFNPVSCLEATIGFLICTDLWFFQHARRYGHQGVHLIACPRATPHATLDKWLAGGRVAAVVSGAYCVSSNKYTRQGADLGGQGWVIDPDGHVLGVTSTKTPFLTAEIELATAEEAKKTYPRYVED
jgi:N-carbamoylputrescine amidase